jgi:hypothetical protein
MEEVCVAWIERWMQVLQNSRKINACVIRGVVIAVSDERERRDEQKQRSADAARIKVPGFWPG